MAVRSDSGAACILWALMLLVLPLNWLLAAAGAALIHEFCHGAAVILTGGKILALSPALFGIRMEIAPTSPGRELVCALAGPIGSLCLLVFLHRAPRLAFCGMVQGFFNLIPVWPMDGGRAVSCALSMLLPRRKAEWVEKWIFRVVVICIVFCSVFCLMVLHWGVFPVITAFFLLFRVWGEKFLANRPFSEYNRMIKQQ